jgi:hypothetical protein
MNITSARYLADPLADNKNVCIEIEIDGESIAVPLDLANRHYAEIMRQVEAGELEIQPADEG